MESDNLLCSRVVQARGVIRLLQSQNGLSGGVVAKGFAAPLPLGVIDSAG